MLLPKFEVDMNSFNSLFVELNDMSERADLALQDSMEKVGRRLQQRIKSRAGLTKHPQHNSKKTRTESPPGDPPARVTGNLIDSVRFDRYGSINHHGYKYFARVSVGARYGLVQERGKVIRSGGHPMRFTYGNRKYKAWTVVIPARPFMRPAKEWIVNSGKLQEILQEYVADLRKRRR